MIDIKEIEHLTKQALDSHIDEEIEKTQPLIEYGMNSINTISLVLLIEEQYGITMDDEDLLIENFTTLERIAQTLSKYI